jgi:hypothetical protein
VTSRSKEASTDDHPLAENSMCESCIEITPGCKPALHSTFACFYRLMSIFGPFYAIPPFTLTI